jgi:hypothetical protein
LSLIDVNASDEFLQRYGNATFPHAAELLSLVRGGQFYHITREECSQPCRHFAECYHRRARTLDEYHHQRDSELYREISSLADALFRFPDAPLTLWLFWAEECSFDVWEVMQPRHIAGCFRRAGIPETRFNDTNQNA